MSIREYIYFFLHALYTIIVLNSHGQSNVGLRRRMKKLYLNLFYLQKEKKPTKILQTVTKIFF